MKLPTNTFLKNNIVAIATAFAAAFLLWYFFQRDVKELSVKILKSSSVISLDQNFSEGIDILYKSIPIKSLYIFDVLVQNTGNRPIETNNFDRPLTLTFVGQVAQQPFIISKKPDQLDPKVNIISNNVVEVNPLLMNSGDNFIFRVTVLNLRGDVSPVAVDGRVVGVKSISVQNETQQNGVWALLREYWVTILSLFLAVFIIVPISIIAYRYIDFVRFRISMEQVRSNYDDLANNPNIKSQISSLGKRLNIDGYDYKNNLLMLRVKIEDMLNELSRKHLVITNKGSLISMARQLSEKHVIPPSVTSALRDILPAINKELHSSITYLNDDDYSKIQKIALGITAELENLNFTGGSPCQMSGQVCPGCKQGIMDVAEGQEGVECNRCGLYIPAMPPK